MHKFVHHRVVQIWQAGCPFPVKVRHAEFHKLFSLFGQCQVCLLYTSDAADE